MSIPAALFACRAARIAAAALFALAMTACSSGSESGSIEPSVGVPFSAGSECNLTYVYEPVEFPPITEGYAPPASQWHLKNLRFPGEDLNVEGAWRLTKGERVQVAVLDDSVEITHPNLQPNVSPGVSLTFRPGNSYKHWPMPCLDAYVDANGVERGDGHGTSVAGLILARTSTKTPSSGVAPLATLAAYDALSDGTSANLIAALTADPQRNAVRSNSWGSPDTGLPQPMPADIARAIETGLSEGRNGLGSIYVFPSGNGRCLPTDSICKPGNSDNSNLDGFSNNKGFVTVCAVNDEGKSTYYSEPGANLLVCAPSSDDTDSRGFVGVTTTAIKGSVRDDFTGTSASVPMVSGVAALVLSVNPKLTWRDVRLILANSARRNDPTSNYEDSMCSPGGSFEFDCWLDADAGTGKFHHRYGYGVVDATKAVNLAAKWQSVGGSRELITCEATNGVINKPVPDNGTTSDIVFINETKCSVNRVEFVEVQVSTTHQYTGDLRITLTSPKGRSSLLVDSRICGASERTADDCLPYENWTFSSTRHLEEPATGQWTLSVTDRKSGKVGRLDSWRLRIYGRR